MVAQNSGVSDSTQRHREEDEAAGQQIKDRH